MASSSFTNRLIHEKSPYLLQHAHNPVDWYPWGKEAFDTAERLDKPIFLSIGYATCHWCHVMEKESFSDPEIAKLMNEAFVNVKVDREELPEVDSIYMELAQALMASAGGWPLNLILTADRKPFFAVTYLPPVNQHGLIGMAHFIQHIQQLWKSDERAQLLSQAEKIVELFEKMTVVSGEEMPDETSVHVAMELLYEFTDPVYGGLKGEPKFPLSYQSTFLLEYAAFNRDSRALFCVQLALDKMRLGGIYDQLGGGFSRYAIDEQWRLPHFEKMLYDNALLARAYLDAWKYTRKETYKITCEETLNYILRDMTHAQGAFFSAEDADSEGKEGAFYTWTTAEIDAALPSAEAALIKKIYSVSEQGNFSEKKNVLYISSSSEELDNQIQEAKNALFRKREQRARPFKDDKILTAWNGLMIDAFIHAGSSFTSENYYNAAVRAAEFIQAHLWKQGILFRRWREGEARFPAGLDDHAFLIKGLLSLFEQGAGTRWLHWAMQLADILDKSFKSELGAFYSHVGDASLLFRKCEFYDGAEPSGNAVHAENLVRLYHITFDSRYLAQAEDIFKASKIYVETYPPGACYHLIALNRYFNRKSATVVIALDEEKSLENEIKTFLSSQFSPHIIAIWKQEDDTELNALIPSLVDKKPIDGQTAVYICREGLCEAPLLHLEDVLKALQTEALTRG